MDEQWAKLKITRKWFSWPNVERVELPIKEISQKFSAKWNITPSHDTKESEVEKLELSHSENQFYTRCPCKNCLEYRETILHLMTDQFNSTRMWNILKTLVQNFYLPIINKAPEGVVNFYNDLVKNDKLGWRIGGIINRTKSRHLEFVSDLFLTDSMIFVLYSTLLLVDDAHQLLELMSFQVECFARSYAEGFKEKLSLALETESQAEDLINYVLEGYTELCAVAEKMGSLLYAFETTHLDQFSLSWVFLNKLMYQKWIHSSFSAKALQCILQLNNTVYTNKHIDLVRRYILFDNEMIAVSKYWNKVWNALNKFHISQVDKQRRERIRAINDLFQALRCDKFVTFHKFVDISEWENYRHRDYVWQNMLVYVKKKWTTEDVKYHKESKIYQESLDIHEASCRCVSCIIAGGLVSTTNCKDWIGFKRTFTTKIEEDYIGSALFDKSCSNLLLYNEKEYISNLCINIKKAYKDSKYHVSWAVFKNLKDRKSYTYETLDTSNFCQNCTKVECTIAKKIINKEVIVGLANILLIYYRPFALSQEEIDKMAPNVMYYYRKVIAMDLLPTDQIDDIVVKTCWTFFHSIFANSIVDINDNSKEINLEHLQLLNNDIELKSDKIDNSQSNTLLDYVLKLKLEEVLLKLPLPGELCNDGQKNTNDWYDSFSCNKTCNDHHSTFEKQDSSQVKVNETIDKLRKKLKSQTSNANKSLVSAKKTEKNFSLRNEIDQKISERDNGRKFKQKLSIEESECCQKISFHEYNNNSVDTWVEDALNFIEGCDKIKCGNKKTEKKARQKLKKEESKRIEELYDLRSQYHDLYFKEFTFKNELKEHKSAKKKDKKLMADLELNIKRLSTAKVRVETRILELLTLVKSISPAFKFAYLPTREQQLQILKKNFIPKQQTIHKHEQVAESSLSTNNVPQHLTLSQCNIIPFTQTIPICEKVSKDCKNDSSKRIVTIRRINLPHVSEPQVTVTAKGVSPEKDKLLYTFVNGQLVPATSLDSLTLKILRPLVPKTKLNKKLPQEDLQSYSNDKTSLKTMLKTKTQLKKDRRHSKSLALEADLKKELNKNINSTLNTETSRNRKQVKKQIINSCVTTYEKIKNNSPSEVSLINIRNQQLKSKSNFKTTVSNVINMENLTRIKIQNKQNNEGNKSALENNQFKLLHVDSSSSSDESEIELKLNTIKSNTIKTQKKNKKRIRKKNEFTDAKQIFKTGNLKQKHEKIDTNILPKIENVNKGTQSSSDKNVINAESMAMSLQNSMQKLNINADTTIEIAKDNMEEQSAIMHLNISIMEQINKGVQVEKLTLPPGITLTKVDPVKAELLRAQRESIGKLLKPMKKQLHSQPNDVPSTLADLKDLQYKQSGIIMVDTMNNKSKVKEVINDSNQSKKKKLKKKKKTRNGFRYEQLQASFEKVQKIKNDNPAKSNVPWRKLQ